MKLTRPVLKKPTDETMFRLITIAVFIGCLVNLIWLMMAQQAVNVSRGLQDDSRASTSMSQRRQEEHQEIIRLLERIETRLETAK